jgi:hypothetical protein
MDGERERERERERESFNHITPNCLHQTSWVEINLPHLDRDQVTQLHTWIKTQKVGWKHGWNDRMPALQGGSRVQTLVLQKTSKQKPPTPATNNVQTMQLRLVLFVTFPPSHKAPLILSPPYWSACRMFRLWPSWYCNLFRKTSKV